MTTAEQINAFALRVRDENLPNVHRDPLRCHMHNTLGCVIDALDTASEQ